MLSFVNIQTGRALIVSDGVEYCLQLLKILLGCWQSTVAAIEVINLLLVKSSLFRSLKSAKPALLLNCVIILFEFIMFILEMSWLLVLTSECICLLVGGFCDQLSTP